MGGSFGGGDIEGVFPEAGGVPGRGVRFPSRDLPSSGTDLQRLRLLPTAGREGAAVAPGACRSAVNESVSSFNAA